MQVFEDYYKTTYPDGVLPGQPGALNFAIKQMLKDAFDKGYKIGFVDGEHEAETGLNN